MYGQGGAQSSQGQAARTGMFLPTEGQSQTTFPITSGGALSQTSEATALNLGRTAAPAPVRSAPRPLPRPDDDRWLDLTLAPPKQPNLNLELGLPGHQQ